jgi:hypothetical protein
LTRVPLGRRMSLAGNVRQKVGPGLQLHLPILISKKEF